MLTRSFITLPVAIKSCSYRHLAIRLSSTQSEPSNPITVNSTEEQEQHQLLNHTETSELSDLKLTQKKKPKDLVNNNELHDELKVIVDQSNNVAINNSIRPKYNLNSLPRVPPTNNISQNSLYLDMLFNSQMPLLSPVQKNHSNTQGQQQKRGKKQSLLKSLENYQSYKIEKSNQLNQNSNYFNTYHNKSVIKLPYNSIFCNTALNTQQHNMAIFNLPLNYLEKLTPFKLVNKPGDEHYRDDLIVLSKIELEELELLKKKKSELKLEKDGKILDIEAFFGFK